MKAFEMSVIDTFRLTNGITVFSGIVSPSIAEISESDCDVMFEGKLITRIHIDGEMILDGKTTAQRAISASHKIDLSELGLGKGGFSIRSRS